MELYCGSRLRYSPNLPSVEEKVMLLEDTFKEFDSSFKQQWDTLPEDYKNDLLDGIVAFEIKVTGIEGKFKLSQNRTEGERERIISKLESEDDKIKSDIAKYMKRQ